MLMVRLSSEERERYIRLCQAGHAAATQGRDYDAHFYFRKATEIYPFGIQVWMWLAKVVETREDRIAALENVLTLSSNHQEARHYLQALMHEG
jgi:hypothetical protein